MSVCWVARPSRPSVSLVSLARQSRSASGKSHFACRAWVSSWAWVSSSVEGGLLTAHHHERWWLSFLVVVGSAHGEWLGALTSWVLWAHGVNGLAISS
jgi:hypothetical protein